MNTNGNDTPQLTTVQEHLERAYDYEEKDMFTEALAECDQAIQLAPDSAEAHNLRGIVLDGLARLEEAIDAYHEAIRANPEFQEAQENLREAEIELKNARKKEKSLDKSPIAGFWRRMLAALIDLCILALPLIGIGFFLVRDFAFSLGPWGRLIGIALMILYFGLGNSSLTAGQTIGKRLTKIAVVDNTGKYLSINRSIWRSVILTFILMIRDWKLPLFQSPLLKLALQAIFSGLALALFYGVIFNRVTRQTIHDLLVGSYVVEQIQLPEVSLQHCPSRHRNIMIGLTVACFLVLIGGTFLIDAGAASRFAEETEWNGAMEVAKALGSSGDFFSVKSTLVKKTVMGYSPVIEILKIEVWAKQLCHRDWERCDEQVKDIVRIALDKYSAVDQLAGVQVIVENRFDWGLASGHQTYQITLTIDDCRMILQQ